MEEVKKEVKKRSISGFITKWISNPYNLSFLALLVFAILLRLHFFSITFNQPLWWDEAEYLNMARAWAFNLEYDFIPVRPVLFSLISALFLKIANNEILPRILILLCSIISVASMYYLGKEMYNEKIGLLSAFFMSLFYLNLFFTYRLLVDIPSLAFFTLSAVFFYKYFKSNSHKSLFIGGVLIAIGVLFRVTTGAFLFAVALFVLVTENIKFIKKKEIWISALIFILVLLPYIIWGYIMFHGFVIAQAGAHNAPTSNFIGNGLTNFKTYTSNFPTYFSLVFTIIFIIGLLLMYKLIIGFDLLIKGKDNALKRDFFLLLLFLIPLLSVSFSIGNYHTEDRYALNSMPAIFIITSFSIITIYSTIKKQSKIFAIILLLIFLAYFANFQYNSAKSLIDFKKDSFSEIREASIWIGKNSNPEDMVISSSTPMTQYYAERTTIGFPVLEEEFEELKSENPNLKYFMLSVMQQSPEWSYDYPQRKNLKLANSYLASNQQPIIAIYELE